MNTGLEVLKMVLMPASTFSPSALNSGPRWSMTGMSMARRIRSGTGVGPGICRKWRPARRGALDMSDSRCCEADFGGPCRYRGLSPVSSHPFTPERASAGSPVTSTGMTSY